MTPDYTLPEIIAVACLVVVAIGCLRVMALLIAWAIHSEDDE